MANKLVLGKGMSSLIKVDPALMVPRAEQSAPESRDLGGGTTLLVPVSMIKSNTHQPRKNFKEENLQELSQSIKENGIIQPLIVIKTENGFELIAGERRLRASILAGLDKVPVIVKRATEREKSFMAVVENVQRSDLNCIEEALAYYKQMEEFKLTQEEVAQKVGKTRSAVANAIRLLKLPREVVQLLQDEKISFGHGKILASIDDRESVIRLANQVLADGLSVRELETLVTKKVKSKTQQVNESESNFFQEKYSSLKENLEKRTGYHFDIKGQKNGAGEIKLKFSNEAEFNDIFEYLMRR